MPSRALRLCRKPGCTALVHSGYCPAHARPRPDNVESLRTLRKDPERTKFYSSRRWEETSKRHRQAEPLCRRCRANGRVVVGELVHHDPPLSELLAQGLNPCASEYLETLCHNCHMAELRARRRGPPTRRVI